MKKVIGDHMLMHTIYLQPQTLTPEVFEIKLLLFLFQVHVAQTSSTADHCLSFALSDSKKKGLQEPYNHPHDKPCQSSVQLKTILNELKDQIKILADKDDDLLYCYQQAAQAVESWKSDLLRSVQQDKARTDILEILDEIPTANSYRKS
jgi:hypothetical protein